MRTAAAVAALPEVAGRTLHLVLPAYNEAAGLGTLLSRVQQTFQSIGEPYRVYVVDDGSRDGTHAIAGAFAARMPLEVIRQPRNLGIAAAFETAFARVCEVAGPNDLCFSLDADNTHDPAHLKALISALDGADVAIASRFAPGGRSVGVPALRMLLSLGARAVLPTLLPVPGARDYSTFFRGYRVSALRRARESFPRLMEGRGFSSMVMLLHRLALVGAQVAEVPAEVRYDLKAGSSGMRIASTIRGYLEVVERARVERARFRSGDVR